MNKLLNTLILLILIFAQTSCERVSFDKPGVDSHDGFELNFNVRNIDTRGLADVSKVCNKIHYRLDHSKFFGWSFLIIFGMIKFAN